MTPPGKIPAALIYGEDVHYLDHLAPLCCLLEMPLIVSEPSVAALAQTFYPNIQVLCYDALTLPETLVRNYDLIFCCTPVVTDSSRGRVTPLLFKKRIIQSTSSLFSATIKC